MTQIEIDHLYEKGHAILSDALFAIEAIDERYKPTKADLHDTLNRVYQQICYAKGCLRDWEYLNKTGE